MNCNPCTCEHCTCKEVEQANFVALFDDLLDFAGERKQIEIDIAWDLFNHTKRYPEWIWDIRNDWMKGVEVDNV